MFHVKHKKIIKRFTIINYYIKIITCNGCDWTRSGSEDSSLKIQLPCALFFGGNMDTKFMDIAFNEAEEAIKLNEVPVGAVIVKDGKVIAKTHNMKETHNCCTSHAEILAIEQASKFLNNWRLIDCDIYVTLDPWSMCASAIKQSRIKNVYSANKNLDLNNYDIINNIFNADKNNASINFVTNLDKNKSNLLLKSFFMKQRSKL